MKKVMLLAAMLFLVALAGSASAEVSPWGLIQSWWSYAAYDAAEVEDVADDYEAATQTGFGIKRGFIGLKWKDDAMSGSLFYHAVPGGSAILIDGWVGYQVNEQLIVKMGRQPGVCLQTRLDSSVKLDLIERPLLSLKWDAATGRTAGRNLGAYAGFKVNEMVSFGLFLHNGTKNSNLLPKSSETNDVDDAAIPQIDLGVTACPMEGVKVGGTFGLANEDRNRMANVTGFGYYDNGQFFGKVDFAMLMHKPMMGEETLPGGFSEGDFEYTSMGFSLTAGYYFDEHWTFLGRFDQWDGDTDLDVDSEAADMPDYWDIATSGDDSDEDPYVYGYQHDYLYQRNLTLGCTYAFNPDAKWDQRLLVNYIRKMDECPDDCSVPDPNLFRIMWQVYLH